jgi:AcrR family transcriptional regulator
MTVSTAPTRIDRYAARRAELGEAALYTLGALGYARTSLRVIADNSAFSHGVLHYYFKDKADLIVCSIRQYKSRCVTRYDHVLETSADYATLRSGFLQELGETVRSEAALHRLWYDLRSQALFDEGLRADVIAIDRSLEAMVERILRRFAALAGRPFTIDPVVGYAIIDGLFQRCLLASAGGDPDAVDLLKGQVGLALDQWFQAAAHVPAPREP